MKKKIVGISPRFSSEENNLFIRVNQNYMDQLSKRGVITIILTPNPDIEQALALCDGYLIIGGDDYNPTWYHETNDQQLSKGIEPILDETDAKIIHYAMEYQKPLLGICRGHQALSALLGSALYQDIEAAHLFHPHEGKYHMVTKINASPLADLLPDAFMTNTFHHQATKELPKGFIPIFRNHDIIEAIEHESLPIISVQWHPERMDTTESDIIFRYFIAKMG